MPDFQPHTFDWAACRQQVKHIVCLTYDQLLEDLVFRLDQSIVAGNAGK